MASDRRAIHLTATCPRCGTSNDLTVFDVREHEKVNCSSCGADLGNLGELQKTAATASATPSPGDAAP